MAIDVGEQQTPTLVELARAAGRQVAQMEREYVDAEIDPFNKTRVLVLYGVVAEIGSEEVGGENYGLARIDFGAAKEWADWGRPKFPARKWLGKPVRVLYDTRQDSLYVQNIRVI